MWNVRSPEIGLGLVCGEGQFEGHSCGVSSNFTASPASAVENTPKGSFILIYPAQNPLNTELKPSLTLNRQVLPHEGPLKCPDLG